MEIPGEDYDGDGNSYDEEIERMERDSRSLSRKEKRGKIADYFEDAEAEPNQGPRKTVRASRTERIQSSSDDEEMERKRRANLAESERLMKENQRNNKEELESYHRNKKLKKANKGSEPVSELIDEEKDYMTKNEMNLVPSKANTYSRGLEPEVELRIFKSKNTASKFEIKAPKRGVMGISAMTQYQSQILQGEELFVRKRKTAPTPQVNKDQETIQEFRKELDPREVHGIDFLQLYAYYTSLYSEFTLSRY
jgi:hypothetical protein